MAKDFLNQGILGGGAGVADKRGFRTINTGYIGSPEYDARFFETFPTVWASGYAFRKSLEIGDAIAVEEWATIFLLHYFGILHLQEFSRQTLDTEYDRDLWLALYGTFPRPRTNDEGDLQSVSILQTNDNVTVGAYYPQVVFFPSRGRENWFQSADLQPFLKNNRLSWENAQFLLEDDLERQRFQLHLRSISRVLQHKSLKDRIDQFCNQHFGSFFGDLQSLGTHPRSWETIVPPDPNSISGNILSEYPLKKDKVGGGVIYYLLNGLDLSYQPKWMTQKFGMTSPANYLRTAPREISVKLAGKTIQCQLGEADDIKMLKDLFIDKPFWSKIGKNPEGFVTHIINKHEVNLQDNTIKQGDRSVCLAPLIPEFLEHFPEIFNDLRNIKADCDPDGNVKWTFYILDQEVCWRGKPIKQDGPVNSSLAMYPPQVSSQWKFYAMYGTGEKNTCGRWDLIDETGKRGQMIELEVEEYVSVLSGEDKTVNDAKLSNRPRAISLVDAGDKERGIFFLSEFNQVDVDSDQPATLAMDFGTSNTCLAVDTGKPETLAFSMSPKMLWGIPPTLESPGFVPRKWGGEKGFFPTILLSRKSDERLPTTEPHEVKLKHLLKVDVPCLHNKISERLIAGNYDSQWRVHPNLKWDADTRIPWRTLFLQSTLLYAHAEIFFTRKAKLKKYAFTYPLAFSDKYGTLYHEKAKDAIKQIRHLCYGEPVTEEPNYFKMDESTAIAKSLKQSGLTGLLEVFVDIGGGTADIAIRHQDNFVVLDSLKVAGKSFFQIAEKTLERPEISGSSQLKKHLEQLLGRDPKSSVLRLPLGALYSVQINELDDRTFKEREESILDQGMGGKSFNKYRSQLFFHHLLSYSLLQACAAAVAGNLNLSNGIKLILGGNGWGLLLFAEWKRSSSMLKQEAEHILALLKANLLKNASESERQIIEKIYISGLNLLNEKNLSEAKNSVALGALKAVETAESTDDKEPFAGININQLKINDAEPQDIKWFERWSNQAFQTRFGRLPSLNSISFEHPENLGSPIDDNLATFIGLGNSNDGRTDNLPATTWQQMNGQLINGIKSMKIDGGKLIVPVDDENEKPPASPFNYFLSSILYPADGQLDFLDTLAEVNGNL
jgi:hypothetical protein